MQGSIATKIGRVIGNLIAHPQYIPRCISHNVINDRAPLDLEVPWFSYAAIDFLDGFLRSEMSVFEYGSGGSTLFFAQRCKSVYAIEDNPKWHELVNARVQQKGLRNVIVKLCPYDFKTPVDFGQSEYLNAMPDFLFDVM